VSIAWTLGALRLTVRDHGPALAGQGPALDLHGRGLTVVAGLSRAFGTMPTADGGKVVWAVLEAPRPQVSNARIRAELNVSTRESPAFTDGFGSAELPFCAGSTPRPADKHLIRTTPGADPPVG
jgi:hypothetical protein